MQQQQQSQEATEEEAIPETKDNKGPGRPPTTGAYYVLQARQAKEAEERDLQNEREILDPLIKPGQTKSYRDFMDQIKTKEEFCHTPIAALEALISERSTDIYKVAIQSKTMKGTFMKQVKEAAADMCAAATVLAIKAQNPEEVTVSEQLKELRHKIQLLRMENAQLRKMVEKRGKTEQEVHKEPKTPLPFEEVSSLSAEKSRRTERWISESSPPLPSTSGSVPQAPTGGNRKIPTPLQAERMEVEEANSITPHEDVVKHMRDSVPVTPAQNEEALVAKLEGICERILDKRLGCPVLSYIQQREAAKTTGDQASVKKQIAPAPTSAKAQPRRKDQTKSV